ncbi:hypothetical protein LY76DRAFT_364004 [Colletotrichum caudatum]|nr:hypothetical protein LY76DRAFT_364004 [Colletotrichum caudatum]
MLPTLRYANNSSLAGSDADRGRAHRVASRGLALASVLLLLHRGSAINYAGVRWRSSTQSGEIGGESVCVTEREREREREREIDLGRQQNTWTDAESRQRSEWREGLWFLRRNSAWLWRGDVSATSGTEEDCRRLPAEIKIERRFRH